MIDYICLRTHILKVLIEKNIGLLCGIAHFLFICVHPKQHLFVKQK